MPSLTVELTYRCNRSCLFCYCGEARAGKAELALDHLKLLLGNFRSAGGRRVAFTGGEPFLRRDLPEIVGFAKGLGLWISLSTNGTHPAAAENRSGALDAVNLVRVSLDGPPKIHDSLRGRGSHKRLMAFLEVLEQAGKPYEIQYTVSRSNFVFLPWIFETCCSLPSLRFLSLSPLLPLGRAASGEQCLDHAQELALYLFLRQWGNGSQGRFFWGSELCGQRSLSRRHQIFKTNPLSFMRLVAQPHGGLFPWFSLGPAWTLGGFRDSWDKLLASPNLARALAVVEGAFLAGDRLLREKYAVDISRLIMTGFSLADAGAAGHAG